MSSYAKQIETIIEQKPENSLLEASALYRESFPDIPEITYYKTLERMSKRGTLVHLTKGLYYRPRKTKYGSVPISEKEIINYYTKDGQGMVIGYRMYNRLGLTTQIGKRVEILSTVIAEQKKAVDNVYVYKSGMSLNEKSVPVIETLEILQNFDCIEDINKAVLATYMREFASIYSDSTAVTVLRNRKYKKSTIAFMVRFLEYFNVNNTLDQFLSELSKYAIPEMEEFYESARA